MRSALAWWFRICILYVYTRQTTTEVK
jgi:hypothetical protein